MPINQTLSNEMWERFRHCVDKGHGDFLAKAKRCDDFLNGKQWAAEDLAFLKNVGRPSLTINKINSTITTLQGEQILNRSEVLFRPSTGGSVEVAEALTKVWMQIAQNNQLPWVRSAVFDDGIVRSRGFYDVRLDFDDNMQGEVRIGLLNSKNVVIDPDADEYDPDHWNDVFITKWLTCSDIEVLYSKQDADYLRSSGDGDDGAYRYDSLTDERDNFGSTGAVTTDDVEDKDGVRRSVRVLERQHHVLTKQKHFVNIERGDTRPVPDGWDSARVNAAIEQAGGKLTVIDKTVQRIRWTVVAGSVVLHDDWSPYTHFTIVPYFPQFRYGTTMGIVEHLLGAQELLNKTTSQELHIVNTTANSGWMVKAGALRNMSIEELEMSGAKTGLVVEVDNIGDAQKILPNPTPQGLDRLSYKAEEHIKTISNVSDSMQGFDREDVAAKAIAYKQQRSSVNHSKAHDNLERSDWLLARNVLDIVQVYYTEPRLLNITTDTLTNEVEQVEINQPDPVTGQIINDMTLGEYNVVVTSAPARATLEDSQFEQALAMRKQGINIPDNVLIENSRLMHRAEIVKAMSAEATSPEAEARKQMQLKQMQLELAKLDAEVKKITADAEKSAADAQLKLAEAAAPPEEGGAVDSAQAQSQEHERAIAAEELVMEQQKLEAEFEFKRAELELKREELALKREDMAAKLRLQKEKQDGELAQRRKEIEIEAGQRRAEKVAELREPSTPTSVQQEPQ